MSKTNDVVFSKTALTHSCLNGQNAVLCAGLCERQTDTQNALKFRQTLPNAKTGDNLAKQSLSGTL